MFTVTFGAGMLRAALPPKLFAAPDILLESFLSFHFQNWRESKDTMHRSHVVPPSVSPLLVLPFLGIDLSQGFGKILPGKQIFTG